MRVFELKYLGKMLVDLTILYFDMNLNLKSLEIKTPSELFYSYIIFENVNAELFLIYCVCVN